MKPLSLVLLTRDEEGAETWPRLCVVFRLPRRQIKRCSGFNRPGLYFLRGYWHGPDPRDFRSYGKVEGFAPARRGVVVGVIESPDQLVTLKV